MLLIDSVKYELWTPQKEVEEFHPHVKEHYREIFGANSLFIEGKRLESESGKGSVPDGFVLTLGEATQWHIVEIELSTHQLYDHIVNQVGRFINGVKNTVTQRKIIEAIYHQIQENKQRKAEFEEAIGSGEIYKFLSDLISKSPVLTIIIEKRTKELDEALDILRYSPIKVVEFQTFIREGVGLAVHAHLFEPLYQPPPKKIIITEITKEEITTTPKVEKRVTIKNLIDAGILKVDQVIYGWYRDKRYEARILRDGKIKLAHNGSEYDSLSAAGTGILHYAVDGWTWWHTTKEDGTECLLAELREEYRRTHPSNP